jgi:hypothetical protein
MKIQQVAQTVSLRSLLPSKMGLSSVIYLASPFPPSFGFHPCPQSQ